ncbi:MAG: vWA domain-containing protein [Christensenella sp.]|nr:vWA domain-containing protein [Christensenella sp.]
MTEIVCLLDRSGSMSGQEKYIIAKYNVFINAKDTYDENTLVTTIFFDEEREYILNGERASYARISPRQYFTHGSTALLDAIGDTIQEMKMFYDEVPEGYSNLKLILLIITDGKEDASREFTYKRIRQMVKQQEECGWSIFFLGVGIDAFEIRNDLGTVEERKRTAKKPLTKIRWITDKIRLFLGIEYDDN